MEQKIVYNFLSAYFALQDLDKKRVKVSKLDSLNDPFELLPYKRYPREKRRLYDKVFESINKKWGLLCFTESWEIQLLWAHYAERHEGVALGFEILRDELIKVNYPTDKKRPVVDLSDDPEENEANFLKLADRKYALWAYERERRILVKLEDCIFEDHNYFLPFGDRLLIKQIVLGCRFDHKNNQEHVRRLAHEFGAEVIPTRQEWQGYRILRNGARITQYQ